MPNPQILARYSCSTRFCDRTVEVPIDVIKPFAENILDESPIINIGWKRDEHSRWHCYYHSQERKLCPQCKTVTFIRGFNGCCTRACYELKEAADLEDASTRIVSGVSRGLM